MTFRILAAALILLVTSAPAFPASDFGVSTAATPRDALLLLGYSVLIAFASLCGGGLFGVLKLTHTGMQLTMSLVGGLMLGIAIFQLLPHAVTQAGIDPAAYALAAGLLGMFLLIRAFHFHAHDAAVEQPHARPHGPGCSHEHDPGPTAHELSWLGVAFGLGIHTLVDGLALGAAIASAPRSAGWTAGVGTFIAIALHKPLDALSITSVMAAARRPRAQQVAVNLAFAAMCPLGAAAFLFGVQSLGPDASYFTGLALGFCAGAFLCIALGDVLPELEFHQHDRVKLTAALLTGVALALAIERLTHGRHG